jgi:hypothetical protein
MKTGTETKTIAAPNSNQARADPRVERGDRSTAELGEEGVKEDNVVLNFVSILKLP